MTTLTNCMIVGNNATGGGGLANAVGTATVSNCTIVSNTSTSGGGLDNLNGTATLSNTIVAAQTDGMDIIVAAGNVTSNYSLIGDGSGISGGTGNLLGSSSSPINPRLAALGDYGGPTLTMALLPGSPAIGAGTAAGAPATDQRGVPRSSHVDLGAFQSEGFTLTPDTGSSPQSNKIGQAFASPLAVTVTAINPAEPVDGGVISFTAPATRASATFSAASATIAQGQAGVTATADTTAGTYTVTASAGVGSPAADFALTNTAGLLNLVARPVAAVAGQSFINVVLATFTDSGASPSDFGAAITWGDGISTLITTVIADGQGRFDVLGTHTYVNVGTYPFHVQVTDGNGAIANASSTATVKAEENPEAASLALTTTRDVVDQFDNLTSLREAIAYANSHPGPDTITFDPSVFGKTPRTIVLTGGPLVLTDPATTTIVGLGANLLTLNGTGQGPVFDIQGGSVALSGMTITGGNGKLGGGLLNAGGTVSLNRVVVRGNRALVGGVANFGTMSLTRVVIRGNRALVGGGLYNDGMATLTNVLIHGNRARFGSRLFNTRQAIIHWRRAPVDRPIQARTSIESPARTSRITSN